MTITAIHRFDGSMKIHAYLTLFLFNSLCLALAADTTAIEQALRDLDAQWSASAAAKDLHKTVSYYSDRKSTRLNSSHITISYAVFCLKKKKNDSLEFCYRIKNNNTNHSIDH